MSGKVLVVDDSWQTRALLATHDRFGKPSQIGLILRAVLHRQGRYRPALGDAAMILEDGTVMCAVWLDLERTVYDEAHLGSIEGLRDDFRRLADLLKLDDKERIEMFNALKTWCVKDARAKTELGDG